jgi:hypothetical protein
MNLTKLMGMFVLTIFLGGSTIAFACSSGPFVETWEFGGVAQWIAEGNDCVLQASVVAAAPSAATAHFRRADPQAPLRLSFVVNPPSLTTLNAVQAVTLASGTARSVPAGGPPVASLLSVWLFGNLAGTQPILGFSAACESLAGGVCSTTMPIEFADFPLRVTVELDMGVGSAGQLRAWLGDDTSGSPQRVMTDLDNAQWGGIDRLSIGVSNVTEQLASMISNQPFTFSQVQVSDPQLFLGDFESDIAGNITANAGSIDVFGPVGAQVNGNTCGGSAALPVIASGSTNLRGPTSIYTMSIPGGTMRSLSLSSSIPGMTAFVCPSGSGPSGPCLGAAYPMAPLVLPAVQAGSYQVVVGSLQSTCGTYSLFVGGPLGPQN